MNKHPDHSARRHGQLPEANWSNQDDPLALDRAFRPDMPNPSPMRWHEPPPESIIPPNHDIPRRKK